MSQDTTDVFVRGMAKSAVERAKTLAKAEGKRLADVLGEAVSELSCRRLVYGWYVGEAASLRGWTRPRWFHIAVRMDERRADFMSGEILHVTEDGTREIDSAQLRDYTFGGEFIDGKPVHFTFSGKVAWKVIDYLPTQGGVRVMLERVPSAGEANRAILERVAARLAAAGVEKVPAGTAARMVREDRQRDG